MGAKANQGIRKPTVLPETFHLVACAAACATPQIPGDDANSLQQTDGLRMPKHTQLCGTH